MKPVSTLVFEVFVLSHTYLDFLTVCCIQAPVKYVFMLDSKVSYYAP